MFSHAVNDRDVSRHRFRRSRHAIPLGVGADSGALVPWREPPPHSGSATGVTHTHVIVVFVLLVLLLVIARVVYFWLVLHVSCPRARDEHLTWSNLLFAVVDPYGPMGPQGIVARSCHNWEDVPFT